MGRAIASVIVGYVVMALVVFVSFTLAYILMGADRTYQPGSYEVSTLWIVVAIVLTLVAAIGGGYVAASIAKTSTPIKVLIGLVLVLGFASVFMAQRGSDDDRPVVREANPTVWEAMSASRQPLWIALLNPLLAVGGILYGASLKKRPTEQGRDSTA
jgi:ABC-type transport system involved in multi-copper enzyme maturation permease subunit